MKNFEEKFGIDASEMNAILGGAVDPAAQEAEGVSCFFGCQPGCFSCTGTCSSCDTSCSACNNSCSLVSFLKG